MALKQFDKIIAVSNYTKQLVGHLKKDVTVIPNGIDLKMWPIGPSVKTLSGHPVLTTVGRVSIRKGQLQVIKLLPTLLLEYPDAHYHCVGMLGNYEDCITEAKALGVEAHVTFHGVLSDTELKTVLSATDVFVMLSQESPSGDVEGFGIAILEANAMSIPAIGATNCGIEDAIEEGVTGFLIDSQDSQVFRKRICQILDHHQAFKDHSLSWAKQHDWNVIIKRYIALIP